MINLFKLIRAYWQGFIGGPDFNHCITRRFILNKQQLSINIPDSNIVTASSDVDEHYPHTSLSWFQQHAETYDQHQFVHIFTKNWMYVPPIALFPSSEYGMLSCQLRIKQVNNINVLDNAVLSRYVTQAYDDYHYGPDGTNTELRRRVVEQSAKRANPWTPEEIEKEIEEEIELHGRQPLAAAIIKGFNQLTWVFYQERRNNRHSYSDYYCLPLSEHSFLEVEFRHRVDLSHKHKKWAKHAFESQERIMASVYIDDLPQEPSIEHNSVSESTSS